MEEKIELLESQVKILQGQVNSMLNLYEMLNKRIDLADDRIDALRVLCESNSNAIVKSNEAFVDFANRTFK